MAVATHSSPALLTIEEYLHTSYRPDCDFVDGYLEERNMGETKHGLLQMEFGYWFRSHQEWNVRAISELRTRVSSNRVRLPDVAIVANDAALNEDLRTTPPLIAIEILSPDDRLDRVTRRLDDFLAMGVPHVWLFDPIKREAHTYTRQGLLRVDSPRLMLPNSPIFIDLPELFAALDIPPA